VGDRKRGVSRRGLFGVFGKGLQSLREGLDEAHRAHSGEAAGPRDLPPDPPASLGDFERVVRPPDELVRATSGAPGTWGLDLGERRLAIGDSVLVSGAELTEPVILVRVNANHWAACTCECPVDGSDILWAKDDDRLRCPGCASEWRLDGASLGGPADDPLVRFVVDAYEDDEGGVEVRLHQP